MVDNGSRDGSATVARDFGATVVSCHRRGYGAACHAGLEAASAPVVAMIDCDGSIDPADVLSAHAMLADADLVIGRRRPVSAAAFPRAARVANRVLARRVRRVTGAPLRDLGPLRVARRAALVGLGVQDRRSGYPAEVVLRAARAGWSITQVDVAYRERIGPSKVTGNVRGYLTAARDMTAVLAS